MQFPATLVQLAEKPPPLPPPHGQTGESIQDWIYPFHAICSNIGSAGRKAPHPTPHDQTGEKSETGSIHFMQFPATLVQLAKKPPNPHGQTGEKSETGFIHFMQFPETWFSWQKSSPMPKQGNLRLDLSISCNFQQLWFSWQKSPPLFCLFMRDLAHATHVGYP